MKGVVAAGHPLTAAGRGGGPARRRQRRRRRGGRGADVVRGRVAAHRAGRRAASCSCTRRRARTTCSTSSWPRPGHGARRARAGATSRRSTSTSPRTRSRCSTSARRPCGAYGTPRRARRGARALRHDAAGRPHRARRRAPRARGWRSCRCRRFLFEVLEPILTLHARVRGDLRARGGRLLERGRDDPAARAGRPARAPRRRGARASSTRATWPRAVSDWVLERGGLLTPEDLAAYRGGRARARARDATAAARCSPTRRRRRAGS